MTTKKGARASRDLITIAIDSSGEPLGAAVKFPDGEILSSGRRGKKQENFVIPLLAGLLSKRGLSLRDVKKIVALRGPGRFTGIRIGLTAALVLKELNGAEASSLTVFETLAYQIRKTPAFKAWAEKNPGGLLACVTRAFRDEYFCQVFCGQKTAGEPLWLESAALLSYLDSLKKPVYCAGPDFLAAKNRTVAPEKDRRISPAAMIELDSAGKSSRKLAPLYLKPARYELLRP